MCKSAMPIFTILQPEKHGIFNLDSLLRNIIGTIHIHLYKVKKSRVLRSHSKVLYDLKLRLPSTQMVLKQSLQSRVGIQQQLHELLFLPYNKSAN